LQAPVPLLELDTAAVDTLENRIELTLDDLSIGPLGDYGLKFCRKTKAQSERRIVLSIELFEQSWNMLLGITHIRTGQTHSVRPTCKTSEAIKTLPHESVEFDKVLWGPVDHGVATRQPKCRNFGTVDSLPQELGRNIQARNSAEEPE